MKYTAIIGAYRGTGNLTAMISSLANQSVKPEKVFIWDNSGGVPTDLAGVTVVRSGENLGCYARFLLAGMCRTSAVMVLDDDTIPGVDWAKSCVRTMERLSRNAILGCRGIRLLSDSYSPFKEAGLAAMNENTQECDLVGHSWFFMRNHARFIWQGTPVRWDTGEDIHFSAEAKKAGIKTYCPVHPKRHKNVWGSIHRELGREPGRLCNVDGRAANYDRRSEVVKYEIEKGWIPMFKEKR